MGEQRLEMLAGTENQSNRLQLENAAVIDTNEKLKNEIVAAAEEKDRMEAKLLELTKQVEESEQRLAKELAERAEAEKLAMEEEAKRRRTPPPPPRPPIQIKQEPNDVPLRS